MSEHALIRSNKLSFSTNKYLMLKDIEIWLSLIGIVWTNQRTLVWIVQTKNQLLDYAEILDHDV